ncbi:UDP-glycosyltransferase 83A1 [Sesamum angolense]|uniref:UDP-glycosyltransferase 83A1 n=1 Tax=Sesamum angolense TaxID=2727404 RepID=A0AAE1VUH9_9LAMI|nr:UDP-glycosyltransferase 83A1 [Sesamum angolense]
MSNDGEGDGQAGGVQELEHSAKLKLIMAVIAKGKRPHVLAVPFPAQGHVTPLMKLSRLISNHGIKVTFVNTQHIHHKILASLMLSDQDTKDKEEDSMVLTSIPDGLAPDDDRNDAFKLIESLRSTMAASLTDLIHKINCSNSDEKVSCILADITVGWVLEVAERVGAEPVGFSPAAAASLAVTLHIPKLIERGNLDGDGNLVGNDVLSLSDSIPSWRKDELAWSFSIDLKIQKIFFEFSLISEKACNQVKWLLCNTSYELEPSVCDLNPKLLPVGPLLNTSNCKSTGNFSSFLCEDTSCLSWLNEKPFASVVYISFGSLAVFSQHQLDELALGLELSGQPFLWVVRSDLANGSQAEYPKGFVERVAGIGKIVEWAPQEKWKIGLRIDVDENGIRTRNEIKTKIEMLLSNDDLKANAVNLKEMVEESVDQGGSSFKNFGNFIDHLKE